MERIYFIDEMTPLLEHSYTDKNGQPQVFAVQGFVLREGRRRKKSCKVAK